MKKLNLILVLLNLCLISLSAQTGPCDLPASLSIHEVPLYWGEKFGNEQNPLKTDRDIRIHKNVKLLLPPYFDHLHLNWVKFEDDNILINPGDTDLSHEYATTGDKNIVYNYYYNGLNNTQVLRLKLKETTGTYVLPDERWTITSDATFTPTGADLYPEGSPYAVENTATGSALACIKYAEGRTSLVKPVIFVAGFDPVQTTITDPSLPAGDNIIRHGGNGWDVFITGADEVFVGEMPDREVFTKYPETMGGFLTMGYDLVFLDFANGGDYIQKNAELLISLLERVNDEKTPDPNGIIHPNVVLGASMGGLITRYALKTMENRNIPHCTKTMITFDSPLKGANAPLGVQSALWFNYAAAQHSESEQDDACGDLQWGYLNQPAARQQLILHLVTAQQQGIVDLSLKRFSDGFLNNNFNTIPLNPADFPADFSQLREDWVAEFAALGYPEKCVRIAIADGNQTGGGPSLSDGGALFNATLKGQPEIAGIDIPVALKVFRLDVFAGAGGTSSVNAYNTCDLVLNIPPLPLPAFLENAKTLLTTPLTMKYAIKI